MQNHLKRNNHLSQHYAGLRKYADKLNFALQPKLDRTRSFMTARETHPSASVEKSGFEDGLMEGSMVANKLGLLMWSLDQTDKERVVGHLGSMEQWSHVNPVLASNGRMRYKWLRAKMQEAVCYQ